MLTLSFAVACCVFCNSNASEGTSGEVLGRMLFDLHEYHGTKKRYRRFQLSIFLASGGNEENRQIENPKVKSLCLSSLYRLMLLSATTSLVCHLQVFTRRGRVAHKTEHISVILRIVQIQC